MRAALFSLSVSALCALCLMSAPAIAQQEKLEAQDQSVVRFDINMDKIVNSKLGKDLGLKDKMQNLPGVDVEEMDPTAVSRVFGSLSLPDNIEALQAMTPGSDLPVELFTRVKFNNNEALSSTFSEMKSEAEEVSIGGKTFFKPTDPEAPQGMLMHKLDDSMMEMGTEKYLTRADRKVMTKGLDAAWKKMPEHAVRIAIDVEGMDKLKAEIIDQVTVMAPPAAAYAELLDYVKNIRITIDLDGDDLFTLSATGIDEESAEEFASGLDSILGLAKMNMNPAMAPNEEAAAVMKEISEALKANLDGTEVSVKIPRPEGFGDVIKGMMPPMAGGF